MDVGRYEQALACSERTLAIQEKALGPEYWPLLELGELELARGRPAPALAWLERALPLAQGVARAEVQLALARVPWRWPPRPRRTCSAWATSPTSPR